MASPEQIRRGLVAFEQARQFRVAQKLPEAAEAFRLASALLPDHPQMLVEYGAFAEEVKDFAAAEKIYRRVGALRPESGYEGRLAVVLFQREHFDEAIRYFEMTDRKSPLHMDLLHALANSYCKVGRWQEGLETIRRAIAISDEDRFRDSELNALHHLGRVDELNTVIDAMLVRFPDSREIRSMYALHKLKSGDYREGFRFFEDFRWRNMLAEKLNPRMLGIPVGWDGVPFDGVLIITTEQGIGDEIMLSSMFEDLQRSGQRTLVECDVRLLPLYKRVFPDMQFMPRQERKSLEFPEGTQLRHVTALDIAHVFRNGNERFPARKAWLQPDAERVAAIRSDLQARFPGKRLVGLSWKSSRVMEGNALKNIAIGDFVDLMKTPDTQFVNLQYGNIDAERAALDASGHPLYVDPQIDTTQDIDSLAALIAALDLVISTSNTTVHLAGCIGAPCWLLLPKTNPILWYWGYRGDKTPWYPSLRLVRNTRDDDWHELLAGVARDLSGLPVMPGENAR